MLTHAEALKKAATDAVTPSLSAATLVIRDSTQNDNNGADLVSFALPNPAFGAAGAAGVATANTIAPAIAAANGTADRFEVRDGSDPPVVLLSGSVGVDDEDPETPLPDIVLADAGITTGTPYAIGALTYQCQPS